MCSNFGGKWCCPPSLTMSTLARPFSQLLKTRKVWYMLPKVRIPTTIQRVAHFQS